MFIRINPDKKKIQYFQRNKQDTQTHLKNQLKNQWFMIFQKNVRIRI